MEYVINPMWFYWLQVCDVVRIVIPCVAIGGAFIIGMISSYEYDCTDITLEQFRKKLKSAIAIALIGAMAVIFIPSQKTLIKMQIAKFGTKDNVEVVLQTIDDKTDKLIEAIGKDK